jgi:hypothetical protein
MMSQSPSSAMASRRPDELAHLRLDLGDPSRGVAAADERPEFGVLRRVEHHHGRDLGQAGRGALVVPDGQPSAEE